MHAESQSYHGFTLRLEYDAPGGRLLQVTAFRDGVSCSFTSLALALKWVDGIINDEAEGQQQSPPPPLPTPAPSHGRHR